MLFLNEQGQLLQEEYGHGKDSKYVDVSKDAYKHLSAHISLMPGASLRSIFNLLRSCQKVQNIFSHLGVEKMIQFASKHKQKTDAIYMKQEIEKIRIYRNAEFNNYTNSLNLSTSHYTLASTKGGGVLAVEFIPLNVLLDVPLVLDGLLHAESENLLNSPVEQKDLYINIPNFNLFEILDSICNEVGSFDELEIEGVQDLEIVQLDDLFKSPFAGSDDGEFPWMGDGPHLGIDFTPSFNDSENSIYNLLDFLPNNIDISKFLKKYFDGKVVLKPIYEGLNAYEFRSKVYGESQKDLPTAEFKELIENGQAVCKSKFEFNQEFRELWLELGFTNAPESMYDCIKQ